MRAALKAGVVVALADLWAVRHAWASAGERAAIGLAIVALAAGAALLLALMTDRRPPPASWLRALAAAIGLTNLWLVLALPRRWYPSLRAALVIGGLLALLVALRRRRDSPVRAAPALGGALVLLVAGRLLCDVSANSRFVAAEQAPTAGLVLDAVTMVQPFGRLVKPITPPPDAAPRAHAMLTHASLEDAHLVLVTVDALRADRLSRMPTLSSLAERGVRFARAYAAAPSTGASVTALLTAHHPAHLDGRPATLQERLRAAGWSTAAFYPAGLFFDGGGALAPYAQSCFGADWVDTRTLPADAVTDAALERLRTVAAHGEPRSFFWLHYFDPHEPYEPHRLPADAPPRARYDAEVGAVDEALARLVDGLSRLQRPTLLVVTADHGEEFGEHGGAYHGSSLYDEQLRVPLVLVALGRPLAPEVVDAPVSLVDVAPTVASLLEAPAVDGDGHNLAVALPPRIFAAVHTRRMVLAGGWKLIRELRRSVDELYDVDTDSAEHRNVLDAHQEVAATLQVALEHWLNQSSVAELASRLDDAGRRSDDRAAAARELGAREAYDGTPALRRALDDGDVVVRAEAALALAQLTDRRAAPTLRALVDEPRLADRAAVMLGRLRDPTAAPQLAAICRRAATRDAVEAALRRDAAHYLGFVGGRDAVDALFVAAADPRLRGAAYRSIARIAARTDDADAARRLRRRLAVEDRADARAELLAALAELDARL